MNSLSLLPEDIRAEFSVNADGQAFATRRAIARLAGVSLNSVQTVLGKLADQQIPHEVFESFVGQSFESDQPIPDTLVSVIIEYYAYECLERYRSEQAKRVCRTFRAIGFRVWVQRELNWQQPQPRTFTLPTSFEALEYTKKSLGVVGIEAPVIESYALTMLANKIDPSNKDIYLDAQKLIASMIQLPETLSTVTEVCAMFESNGITITPRTLNKLLCELGLQIVTRDSKGKIQYQLTEASQGMGKLILNSTGGGKSVPQLKWYAEKVARAISDRIQK